MRLHRNHQMAEMKQVMSSSKGVTLIACLAVICTQIGIGMYAPSIPFLAAKLHSSYSDIGYTFTAYVLGYGLAMLVFGGLSDQLGRKKSFFITTLLFIAASFYLVFTHSIWMFIITRLIQGLGGGGCAVIARSAVRDLYEGKKLVQAMSSISMTFNVSMGFFQYLGGIFQTHLNYQADFVFMGCWGVMVLLLVFFYFKETQAHAIQTFNFRKLFADYASIIQQKQLMVLAIAAGMGYSILLIFNVLGVCYLQYQFNFSAERIGQLGIYFSLAYLVGGITVNVLLQYFSTETLIQLSKSILLLSGIFLLSNVFSRMHSANGIIFPILLALFAQAMLYPCLMTKAVQPFKKISGAASSLFGFTQQLAGFAVTQIATYLSFQSALPFGVLILCVCVICFLLLLKEKTLRQTSESVVH